MKLLCRLFPSFDSISLLQALQETDNQSCNKQFPFHSYRTEHFNDNITKQIQTKQQEKMVGTSVNRRKHSSLFFL